MWKVLLTLFVLMAFNGCSTREIIVTKKVKVPVSCVVPEVYCKRTPDALQFMDSEDIIIELVRCIGEYEEKIMVCRPKENIKK